MNASSLALPAALLLLSAFVSGQTAPVAHDDASRAAQGDHLSVSDPDLSPNGRDAEGDTLSATLVDSSGDVGQLFLLSDGSFESEPGPGATGYTDETLFLNALAAQGLAAQSESFEDDATWGAARAPNTSRSVTSQGITWESPIGARQVTTGPGPAFHGNFGFFALSHGDELVGAQRAQPDVCTDRWRGTSDQPLVAIGGWLNAAGQGKIALILDGDEASPVDLGDGDLSSWRFFGVIAPSGFDTFEFREQRGTRADAVYIFGDKFTFARAAPGAWADLGGALAGSDGLPELTGVGPLVAETPWPAGIPSG